MTDGAITWLGGTSYRGWLHVNGIGALRLVQEYETLPDGSEVVRRRYLALTEDHERNVEADARYESFWERHGLSRDGITVLPERRKEWCET